MNKHVKIRGREEVLKGGVSLSTALKILDLWAYQSREPVSDPFFKRTVILSYRQISVKHHRDGTSTISAPKHYWLALEESSEVKQ